MLRKPTRSRKVQILPILFGLGLALMGAWLVYFSMIDPSAADIDRSGEDGAGYTGFIGVCLVVLGVGIGLATNRRRKEESPAPVGDQSVEVEQIARDAGVLGLFVKGAFAIAFTAPILFISDSLEGSAGDVAMFFITIAIGVCLQIWFWHGLLARFQPRVKVMSNTRACVGEPANIEISLRGLNQIRSVNAWLVGREEAAYTVGTDSVTDTAVFFEAPIAALLSPGRSATLIGCISLPATTVPTFHADHNHVRWVVVINADIAWWPDVDQEYEIDVAPGGRCE